MPMRMRAMSTAVLLFVANLIGYGFGPLFIGAISDMFFTSGAAELGVSAGELARNQCHPNVIGELSENFQTVCGQVYAQSLQTSMVIMAVLGTDKLTILRLRSGSTLPLSASNCARNRASGP